MTKTTLKEEADALRAAVIQVGEIVIIKKSLVKPEFRHDLRFACRGGFGVDPALRGTALIGTWLADGERCRLERYDVDWTATARYRREMAKVETAEEVSCEGE